MAELCDPGLRRPHNEDAVAIAEGEALGDPFTVLVVCDGVSSSSHADQASSIAARVARDAIVAFARSSDAVGDASPSMVEAIRMAHRAICDANIDYGDGAPPGTTIVAALVYRHRLTVGWVGDSRAYWASESGSELCTTDHSWINDVVANGGISVVEAMASPLAHALTRCLGPLENDAGYVDEVVPDVRTKVLTGPGHLILCTDGLWNYFPSAKAIADLARGAGEAADPEAVARFLVCRALAEGGGDNVSVAVHAVV
jgi:serine/threonine protein phosphatase PrpC